MARSPHVLAPLVLIAALLLSGCGTPANSPAARTETTQTEPAPAEPTTVSEESAPEPTCAPVDATPEPDLSGDINNDGVNETRPASDC